MPDAMLSSLRADSMPLLHELADVLEFGMATLDRDLVVRNWNRWLTSASGIQPQDAIGRELVALFPELDGSPAEGALRQALGGSSILWAHHFHRYFLPLPAPTGHQRFTRMQQSTRVLPLVRDGAVEGVLVLIQDVTERVAREEELREALQRAEGASQAKSEFLASMSHELRTPLSAVVGYMDLLQGEMVGPVAPQQKTYLERVKLAARHLMSIIEEILTFARVEAGKEVVHCEMLDATAVARSVGELFEPEALLKGLTLDVEVPDGPVMLATDGTKLRQILINLLGNATKFTDSGKVTLGMEASGDSVRFHIRDTGMGIRATDLDRIFDPFTQIDQSLRRSKGGTGLGLPVSRRLAHLLGGELSVESVIGQGTRFTLSLPVQLTPAVAETTDDELSRGKPAHGSGAPAGAATPGSTRAEQVDTSS